MPQGGHIEGGVVQDECPGAGAYRVEHVLVGAVSQRVQQCGVDFAVGAVPGHRDAVELKRPVQAGGLDVDGHLRPEGDVEDFHHVGPGV